MKDHLIRKPTGNRLRPWLLPVLGVWISLAGTAVQAQTNTPPLTNRLPKIRVAAAQRAFVSEIGQPFVPFGVTYYRPGTGWAPQVWTKWDAEATRKDFAAMRRVGVNCARVFLSYHSFYSQPGILNPEGLAKFDQFLEIAEAAGIYVHPTGPDHWEGPAVGQPVAIEDPNTVAALEKFWQLFAARYRGRSVIFGYDLKNEPELAWDSDILRQRWNTWLAKKYPGEDARKAAWGTNGPQPDAKGILPPPSDQDALKSRPLLDYQTFREEIADEWTRRQATAIKTADPDALVTVGLIQWAVPALLPGPVKYYAAFRPARQAKFLDFLEIHFYPFAQGAFEYRTEAEELHNLSYLESVVRETVSPDKPTILAEFGWYGGGKPRFDNDRHPAATEEQQANYCRRLVETTAGFVCGWLNWGFYDTPEATDCSEFTGLARPDGQLKAWGKTFQMLAQRYQGQTLALPAITPRPTMDWDACLTSLAAAREFREKYHAAFATDPARKEN